MNREVLQVSNRRLEKKWQDRNRQLHLRRLRTMKASVDNKPPKTYPHLMHNSKKRTLEEDRYRTIEHENKILLKKMTTISKSKYFDDAKLHSPSKSLNYGARKRELTRIADENYKILRRLEDRKPNYQRRQWDSHRKAQQKYLKNICVHPYDAKLAKRRRKLRKSPRRSLKLIQDKQPTRQIASSDTKTEKILISKSTHEISGRSVDVVIVLDQEEKIFSLYAFETRSETDYVVDVPVRRVDDLVRKVLVDFDGPSNNGALTKMLMSRLYFDENGEFCFNDTIDFINDEERQGYDQMMPIAAELIEVNFLSNTQVEESVDIDAQERQEMGDYDSLEISGMDGEENWIDGGEECYDSDEKENEDLELDDQSELDQRQSQTQEILETDVQSLNIDRRECDAEHVTLVQSLLRGMSTRHKIQTELSLASLDICENENDSNAESV